MWDKNWQEVAWRRVVSEQCVSAFTLLRMQRDLKLVKKEKLNEYLIKI